MSPFDFVKQINYGKRNLIDENPELEKEYKQYIINRALSFNYDTVLYANEMNVKNHVDSKLQFDFFLNTIRPKKRYGKWLKRENNGVLELINKHFPDFRRVINELQRYSTSGDIDSGVLANIGELNLNLLISALREKNFQKMRQWVTSNVDNDPISVYRKIYDKLYDVLEKSSIPSAVLIIADYQYKSAFVADQEVNLVACLVELMAECEFV